ncbi:MAG: HmuY family protein [Flavobacteriales bacterium]|nr:HmuY family protein [Flavobacteriales bacterium]
MIKKIILLATVIVGFSSCFKDIDIDEPRIHITPKEQFSVEHNIQEVQSFFRFYESAVVEVSNNSPSDWDLAFEASEDGYIVMPNYGMVAFTHQTSFTSIDDVTIEYIESIDKDSEKWNFDDPAYSTRPDSLYLSKWENGNVFVLKRGVTKDNFIALKLLENTKERYSFEYKSVTDPSLNGIANIKKTSGLSYVYFSFKSKNKVDIEPLKDEWHVIIGPYYGWYETKTPGEYASYRQSGFLINSEAGVEVAQVFDEDIEFSEIDYSFVGSREFSNFRGGIGSNWKVLGSVTSGDLYSMDPYKKYIIKVYDKVDEVIKYYKLRIISYKNSNGKDHYPTVEFKLLEE